MNIEKFYQDFIESDHSDSPIAAAAINSVQSESAAESVTDGIDFMKGAIR